MDRLIDRALLLTIGIPFLIILGTIAAIELGPTILNITLSYYIAKNIFRKDNYYKYAVILPTVLISMLLGFNIRIPNMINNMMYAENELNVYTEELINGQAGVVVKANIDKIIYRKHPFRTINVNGNEGCMCFFFRYPYNETIHVKESVLMRFLSITNDSNAGLVMDIKSKDDGFLNTVKVNIYRKNELVSTATKTYITSYPLEATLFDNDNHQNFLKVAIYIAQYNVWNYILGFIQQDNIIDKIVEKTFITPNKSMNYTKEPLLLQASLLPVINKSDAYSTSTGRSGDIILCDESVEKIQEGVFTSKYNNSIHPISPRIRWHNIEKVLCTGNEIYFFDTQNDRVLVESYSRQGQLINLIDIVLPKNIGKGSLRKSLIYFKRNENGLYLGLLTNGRKIYYFVPHTVTQ